MLPRVAIEPSTEIGTSSRKKYFDRNRENLKKVYEVFRDTQIGKKLGLPVWDINNYSNFKKLPVMDPRQVNFNELFVPAEGLWRFVTTGVSGNRKTVYRDIGTIVGYPADMDMILRSNPTVFLHSKRRAGESYYETHDVNHKRMYPSGIFGEYQSREQLLEHVQKGKVLFIIEYPLMAEWICYQLEEALESKEISSKRLLKKRVYLELSGEPVEGGQLQRLVSRLESIFRCDVEYFVTYGSNEIGHIGTYVPALHGFTIAYEVIPSLFVEEIDEEVIITPFRINGTILFRYKVGDKGTLLFIDDKPFLKIEGKSKDEGILYVAGAQVNIPQLFSKVEEILPDCPIGARCMKKEDRRRGTCALNIGIHTPRLLDPAIRNRMSLVIREYITTSAVLSVENHLGVVSIDMEYSTKPVRKRLTIIDRTRRA
jgi:hypothetical protein